MKNELKYGFISMTSLHFKPSQITGLTNMLNQNTAQLMHPNITWIWGGCRVLSSKGYIKTTTLHYLSSIKIVMLS